MKHGKKYNESAKLVDSTKVYESGEALDLVCKTAKAKFDETVELHVRLGVDSRHADQQVRGAVVLPNGTGKTVRTLVFCKPEKEADAKAAGADYIADNETVAKIQGGWMDFEVVIATPDMMGVVGRLGKVLGPRGLMPNPKAGTVTPDVAKAVQEAKAGKIEYRLDKANILTFLYLVRTKAAPLPGLTCWKSTTSMGLPSISKIIPLRNSRAEFVGLVIASSKIYDKTTRGRAFSLSFL